jgi:hypothetical protein
LSAAPSFQVSGCNSDFQEQTFLDICKRCRVILLLKLPREKIRR